MIFKFSITGLEALKSAIINNPSVVKSEVNKFLTRATALYMSTIQNNPWRMGMSGGGSPVAVVNGGNLRDTHRITSTPWSKTIEPTASYAPYVHGLEGFSRKGKYQLRPWLDYAFDLRQKQVSGLEADMINSIVNSLAK